MLHRKSAPLLSLLLATLIISGCQSARKALNMDTSVALRLSATETLNPDSDDRPSPVVLHVFELADDRQFSREDFLSLYEGAAARLGKDLIGSVALKEITPGEERVETLPLSAEVKYIGVMAEFIQYRDAEALLVFPVLEHNQTVKSIRLDENRIAIVDEVPAEGDATPHKELRNDRSSQ